MTELFKRGNIHFKNRIGLRESLNRTFNTALTQQMQYGKRRTVGVVADLVKLGAVKLELRVLAGQLDHTFQLVLIDHAFGYFKKVIEVQKVFKQRGVNQQRGVNLAGGCGHQQVKLTVQFLQQVIGVTCLADDEAHLIFDVDGLGKWAKVQANHGGL
jgi:hypothetical protein